MAERTIQRANPKAPLSAPEVAAALKRPPSQLGDVLTLREKHLALRIGADGIGSWLLERKFEGAIVRRLVGYSDQIGLGTARKQRDRIWHDIVSGNDPLKLKRERMAARAAAAEERRLKRQGYRGTGNTLEVLLDRFGRWNQSLLDGSEQKKGSRSWHRSRQQIEHHFAPYLDVDISRIGKSDIRAVLDRGVERGSPVGVKRSARYLSRVFAWAVRRDLLEINPVAAVDLDEHCGDERARDRILSDREIKAVWCAADELTPPWGAFVKLLMLTGLRRQELAELRWADVQGGVIVLASTKTEPHRLPLSGAAQNIIARMPRTDETVFGLSTRPNFEHRIAQLHKLSGTSGWGFHDLRRTHRTILARLKVDDLVAELALNHALPGQLRRIYNQHKYQDEMREAADKLARFVLLLAEGDGSNVVALPATEAEAKRA